jgi:hypothetical protein
VGYGGAIHISVRPRVAGARVGTLRDVRLRNVRGRAENSVRIDGSPDNLIEDVLLDDIDMTIDRWTTYPGGNFDNRPTMAGVEGLEPHDTPVFSIRNASRVLMKDCKATWGKRREPYWGPALEVENVKYFQLTGFKGEASDPAKFKAIADVD